MEEFSPVSTNRLYCGDVAATKLKLPPPLLILLSTVNPPFVDITYKPCCLLPAMENVPLMAAGGLPVRSEDSVKNTVLASIEMQKFITQRKSENDAQNKPAFEMRLGIHTGPVVAGIVGVKKFQYDVWGDTVNTASRMESAGEVGQVNISQDTYELIRENTNFNFNKRGKIEVKGKGEMDMYFVK